MTAQQFGEWLGGLLMRKPLIAVLPLALLCSALAAKAIMKKRRALPHVIVLLALCFLASPVLAEEVLHCIDTENTGFHWEGGHASKTNFELSRFFVKIGPAEGAIRLLSENDRLITQASEGVLQHKSAEYRCEKISGMGSIVCNDKAANGMPWLFGSNGHYVRAYLLGGPAGPLDPKLAVL